MLAGIEIRVRVVCCKLLYSLKDLGKVTIKTYQNVCDSLRTAARELKSPTLEVSEKDTLQRQSLGDWVICTSLKAASFYNISVHQEAHTKLAHVAHFEVVLSVKVMLGLGSTPRVLEL